MQELMDHLRVHYRPTQSLEGKTFHCPTLGCTETFPSMQDLMAHMKVHYKPNRYFKCENCLLRFRTHRSLFKHLHVCSDSASGPAPPPRADRPGLPPATSAPEKEPPAKPPEALPKLPSALRPLEKEAVAAGADTAPAALPTALPELPGSLEPLPLCPPVPPSMSPGWTPLCPSLGGRGAQPGSLLPHSGSFPWEGNLRACGARSTGAPAHVAPRHHPAPGDPGGDPGAIPVLPCPPVLAGHSSNSRIVWEHTRGRYSCTQCPFSTASRDEMTLHTEDHRKNPPPGRLEADMDFGVGLAPFHAKLPPEMENSLYSQL
ncbi:ZN414 protein, partial [Edolisoma coerulescens]|nr:ZN414 protein [Edolisoma coerulescens]